MGWEKPQGQAPVFKKISRLAESVDELVESVAAGVTGGSNSAW